MRSWWQQIDRLLRGRESALGESALAQTRAGPLVLLIVLLAALYGFFMGWYALFSRPEPEWRQLAACVWKVPALYLLTLFICFPSLYVFSTLVGSRLRFGATLKVLLAVITITATVLASLGPIVAFFAVSTENYPFMKLLNVAFFAVAGFLGVGALLKALRALLGPGAAAADGPGSAAAPASVPPLLSARDARESDLQIRRVFRIWIVIYALVGAQMGWVLRPFLGSPGLEFTWFRAREANVFIDLWRTFLQFFQ